MKSYLFAATFGTIYAAILSTDEGKAWIDENTTLGVVLGVGAVMVALRGVQSPSEWRRTIGMFAAAGGPLVVRGVLRKLA